MWRVVLDSAALIAALISPKGAPRALVRAWTEGAFELLTSPKRAAQWWAHFALVCGRFSEYDTAITRSGLAIEPCTRA